MTTSSSSLSSDLHQHTTSFAQEMTVTVRVAFDKKPHVAFVPQRRFLLFTCCVAKTLHPPVSALLGEVFLLRNKKKNSILFWFFCTCFSVLQEAVRPSRPSAGPSSGFPCLSTGSEYKYELRLALLSDE